MSGTKRVIVTGTASMESIRRAALAAGATNTLVYDSNGGFPALPPSISDIAITRPDTSREDEEATLKRVGQAGKCRYCGKWQTNVWHHETNTCEKRFRRKR